MNIKIKQSLFLSDILLAEKNCLWQKCCLSHFLFFLLQLFSFIFTGLTTYLLDQVFPIINGQPTNSDMITYLRSMISGSLIITLISFIPLFLFGIWKRGTISTVICAIVIMNLPKFPTFLNLEPGFIIAVLCILGALSIYLSIKTAESVGGI